VVHIERDTSYSFARIYCVPVAGVENFGEVMVLEPRKVATLPPELTVEASGAPAAPEKGARVKKKRVLRD